MSATVTALLSSPPAAAQPPALRATITDILAREDMTQTALARQAGLGASALSTWLRGRYRGDNTALESALQRWLDHRAARAAQPGRLPAAPAWVPTPTAARIAAVCQYAQLSATLALISGGAGCGKTHALRHYATAAPSAWLITATPASATLGGTLRAVARALGVRHPAGQSDALELAVIERAQGTGGVLLIDEAQHLHLRAIECARALSDAAEIGLVLAGAERVASRLIERGAVHDN